MAQKRSNPADSAASPTASPAASPAASLTASAAATVSAALDPLVIDLEPAELRGLYALADVTAAASGKAADLTGTARSLLHDAVQAKLDEIGLKWDPTPASVGKRAAEAAKPDGAIIALMKRDRVRRYGLSALMVALLVLLWGGYVKGWQWTGFAGNDQLWDWLHLLLLPLVVGTVPLWLRHREYVSRPRRWAFLLLAVAFAAFVAVGYLVPLTWTGFAGNTLWSWLSLLLLPVAVTSARFVPSMIRSLRRPHRWGITVVAAIWCLTIVGGYAWDWVWTGYQGNTLWDWLQLLLLPLIVPTLLMPAAVRWVSDNAPGTSRAARSARSARAPLRAR
jgi:hypothetical protein